MLGKYKTFITSGCSFTAGFSENLKNDYNLWKHISYVWPHFTFYKLWSEKTTLINFARSGGSNIAAMNNLIYYFESTKNYDNVLVGFNITSHARQDVICSIDDPEQKYDLSNHDTDNFLKIGWKNINNGNTAIDPKFSSFDKDIVEEKLKNYNEAIIFSCLTIIQAITYLETKNIDYFFMFMTKYDYHYTPLWFKEFIDNRKKNFITFDKDISIMEFVKKNNLNISNNDLHPNKQGHDLISEYVVNHLKNKL